MNAWQKLYLKKKELRLDNSNIYQFVILNSKPDNFMKLNNRRRAKGVTKEKGKLIKNKKILKKRNN